MGSAMLLETKFRVPKMDCPSEERLIRMALEKSQSIKKLTFDLSDRTVTVLHEDSPAQLLRLLEPLKFGASEIGTRKIENSDLVLDDDDLIDATDEKERKALVILLAINGTMFVAEIALGFLAQSTGLIADSLDMLADALVYGDRLPMI